MLKFSVLISVYSGEKPEYMIQSFESIINQTLKPSEIVIVKDGPLTKDLDEVIELYQKKYGNLFRIISFEKNRGLGLALRDGVLSCTYDYIARMDTDDISLPDRFEKQVCYLTENPEVALVGAWIREFSTCKEKPDSETELPLKNKDIVTFARSRNPLRHMTVMFKKQAVLESGNFRDFLWFEDYDLWIRMIQHGFKLTNIPEFLVLVRADSNMFARRGGYKYLKQDIQFQLFLYRTQFIDKLQFLGNVLVRGVVRLVPNHVRIFIYKNFLRK